MAGVVIADAGPLIALASIDRLDLLGDLFGSVRLPLAVRDESLAKPGPDSDRIEQAIGAGMLVVESIADNTMVPLPRSLGHGEIQAISLAVNHKGSLLLMDDRLARKQAGQLGISFVGTARLLFVAEQKQLIEKADDEIARMRANGYRISPELLHDIRHRG